MRKILGSILFVLGVLTFVFSGANFTGNVVSNTTGSFGGAFGLILMVLGSGLVSQPSGLEKVVSSEERSPRVKDAIKTARQEVKSVFRQWDGKLTGAQKRVLKRYGVQTSVSGDHVEFYMPNVENEKVVTGTRAESYRTGKNFVVGRLLPYIEKHYGESESS